MNSKMFICHTWDIDDPGSLNFHLDWKGEHVNGFAVGKNNMFFAYHNVCPHVCIPLDWVEHQFLDPDKALIQCANHDARFIIEDGLCISGPCLGKSLKKIDVVVVENTLYLTQATLS